MSSSGLWANFFVVVERYYNTLKGKALSIYFLRFPYKERYSEKQGGRQWSRNEVLGG